MNYTLTKMVGVGKKVTEIHTLVWADLPQNWTYKIFDRLGMLKSKLPLSTS